jgi:hypothetical protein
MRNSVNLSIRKAVVAALALMVMAFVTNGPAIADEVNALPKPVCN